MRKCTLHARYTYISLRSGLFSMKEEQPGKELKIGKLASSEHRRDRNCGVPRMKSGISYRQEDGFFRDVRVAPDVLPKKDEDKLN